MKEINLPYIDARFYVDFEKPFSFATSPAIVFRSILGCRLKKISCLAPRSKCPNCQFHKTCVYAVIFETIIEKDTDFLSGRDKGSHPFRFKVDKPVPLKTPLTHFAISIQLYGFAVQYLPYVFYALREAGQEGLFKEKAVFHIRKVMVDEMNILHADGTLQTNFAVHIWQYPKAASEYETHITKNVRIVSPLRFKVHGKYSVNFSAQDFLYCIHRRLITLCSLYGKYKSDELYHPSDTLTITNRKLMWQDYDYHSHRQNAKIKMGGIVGSFCLTGTREAYDAALLDFAGIFGAGKNTNFGLGNLIIT